MRMRIEVSHKTDVDKWIIEHHYLHSVPAVARLRLWVKDDAGNIIGAMMWGRPTARAYDSTRIMELTRLCMIDDTEHCAESRAIGMARKYIRKHYPEIKGLISYSSTGEHHKGTVYLADGWFSVGLTRGNAWSKRGKNGRANIDTSQKIRWVRSV
jgi:hypothetical protein